MAKYPLWTEAPEIWDSIKIGDATLPGTCEVVGGSLGVREDIVEEEGGKFRVNTLNYRPAEVEIVVSMWEQAHLDKYKEISKLYRPRKNGDRRVFEVLHPWLEIYDITALYIIDMELPRKKSVGLYQATLRLREFWEVREEVQKGTVAVGGPGSPVVTPDLATSYPEAPSEQESPVPGTE